MAVRKGSGNKQAGGNATEQKVVALAEQLGWFLGSVQAKADGWLDREKLRDQVVRIRDGAADLLQHVDAAIRSARLEGTRPKAEAKPKVAKAAKPKSAALNVKPDRGPVDAPGKRHRKPPPQERLDKRMGEPVGKHMGQKNFKLAAGRRRISG